MAAFFTRERFGRPQVYAGLLLLLFVAQCVWLMCTTPLRGFEVDQIYRGLLQWRFGEVGPQVAAADAAPPSPLIALIASAGLAALGGADQNFSGTLPMLLARLPFLFLALLRAASLWYVTRRLYGNAGGYVALALYCFSFPIIEASALVNPHGPAAWGFFGAIFSGIALSHTVYALGESPREQIAGFRQWRWRRIVLLGVAFGVAVGSHFFTAIVILLTLGFMLYLAPGRRVACLGIVAVACAIGTFIVLGSYFFHIGHFLAGLSNGLQLEDEDPWRWRIFAALVGPFSLQVHSPAVFLSLVILLATYLVWRRTRYFGNSAPLLVLLLLWLAWPLATRIDAAEQLFITFAFVFIAGIMADLVETASRKWVMAGLLLVLLFHATTTLSLLLVQTQAREIVHPETRFGYHLPR
ncbi:MAG: hypothetical protein L0Z53_13680 [Acidobacteriales bacterium]|nr:hypothetical protein [Terriglobales bacterium]